MDVSATMDGNSVNIVDVDTQGMEVMVTYLDTSANLNVKRKIYPFKGGVYQLATSASVN